MGHWHFSTILRLLLPTFFLALLLLLLSGSSASSQEFGQGVGSYRILKVASKDEAIEQIIEIGVTLERVGAESITIEATLAQVKQLQALGFQVEPLASSPPLCTLFSPDYLFRFEGNERARGLPGVWGLQ